jgi:hypothetical protein
MAPEIGAPLLLSTTWPTIDAVGRDGCWADRVAAARIEIERRVGALISGIRRRVTLDGRS